LGKNANAPLMLLSLAALTAAVALFAFYLFSRPPGDGSAEAGFARDMSVHHAQAVEMAEVVRDKTESEEIRTLAKDIALTQQGQIGQMRGWLDVWGLSPTGSEPAMAWMGHPTRGRMHGMASTEELERLREASPEEADRLFLQLMIPHHEAAVPMAEAAMERSDNPEVERLAEAIITSQTGEIKVMEAMLRERGEEPSTEDSHSHSMESM
jgi:uncharacterized protein (DUF305 family)